MGEVLNLFSGLKGAKAYDKGVWLKEGTYVIRVKRGVFKHTRSKGDAFILEFEIVKSTYDEAKKKAITAMGTTPFDMKDLEKILPNQAGTSASWYQSLKDKDIGFGALKGFAASILGMPSEDPAFLEGVEVFMSAVCQSGAIDGQLIPCEAVMTQTKEKKDFSLHKWGQILQSVA